MNRAGPGTAPVGVPDSYDEHVKLMFDLQALAFQAEYRRAPADGAELGRVLAARTGVQGASLRPVGYKILLEVLIRTPLMREKRMAAHRISASSSSSAWRK